MTTYSSLEAVWVPIIEDLALKGIYVAKHKKYIDDNKITEIDHDYYLTKIANELDNKSDNTYHQLSTQFIFECKQIYNMNEANKYNYLFVFDLLYYDNMIDDKEPMCNLVKSDLCAKIINFLIDR